MGGRHQAVAAAPVTRPVAVWLWVAPLLTVHGDDALAARIRSTMEGRRLWDTAAIALSAQEWRRVNAVLQDWLSEPDPE